MSSKIFLEIEKTIHDKIDFFKFLFVPEFVGKKKQKKNILENSFRVLLEETAQILKEVFCSTNISNSKFLSVQKRHLGNELNVSRGIKL